MVAKHRIGASPGFAKDQLLPHSLFKQGAPAGYYDLEWLLSSGALRPATAVDIASARLKAASGRP